MHHRATGAFLGVFVAAGSGGLDGPQGIAFGADGHLYVSSSVTNTILRYDGSTGAFLDAFVPAAANGGLSTPAGLTFGPDGNLYVASPWNFRVDKYVPRKGADPTRLVGQRYRGARQ